MNSIGLEYFLDIYTAILEHCPELSNGEAVEAAKAAIWYEIHRDWMAEAKKGLH